MERKIVRRIPADAPVIDLSQDTGELALKYLLEQMDGKVWISPGQCFGLVKSCTVQLTPTAGIGLDNLIMNWIRYSLSQKNEPETVDFREERE